MRSTSACEDGKALTSEKSNLNNALSGGDDNSSAYLQGAVFPRDVDLEQGNRPIAEVTRRSAQQRILLPYTNQNGSSIYLGDSGAGYPPQLYPNLTSGDQSLDLSYVNYEDKPLYSNSTLILGPLFLNDNVTLISMTVAINSECCTLLPLLACFTKPRSTRRHHADLV